jgi:glutamine synthetase
MLRPTLNMDYFHDLYDMAEAFDIHVEGHRKICVAPSPPPR